MTGWRSILAGALVLVLPAYVAAATHAAVTETFDVRDAFVFGAYAYPRYDATGPFAWTHLRDAGINVLIHEPPYPGRGDANADNGAHEREYRLAASLGMHILRRNWHGTYAETEGCITPTVVDTFVRQCVDRTYRRWALLRNRFGFRWDQWYESGAHLGFYIMHEPCDSPAQRRALRNLDRWIRRYNTFDPERTVAVVAGADSARLAAQYGDWEDRPPAERRGRKVALFETYRHRDRRLSEWYNRHCRPRWTEDGFPIFTQNGYDIEHHELADKFGAIHWELVKIAPETHPFSAYPPSERSLRAELWTHVAHGVQGLFVYHWTSNDGPPYYAGRWCDPDQNGDCANPRPNEPGMYEASASRGCSDVRLHHALYPWLTRAFRDIRVVDGVLGAGAGHGRAHLRARPYVNIAHVYPDRNGRMVAHPRVNFPGAFSGDLWVDSIIVADHAANELAVLGSEWERAGSGGRTARWIMLVNQDERNDASGQYDGEMETDVLRVTLRLRRSALAARGTAPPDRVRLVETRWTGVTPYDRTLPFAGGEIVAFPDLTLPPGEARLLRVEVDPVP